MSSKKRTLPEIFASISPEISAVRPPPKIAVSTLRGFQLLDSSSDDISSSSDEEDQSGKHNPTAQSSGLYLSNDVSILCPSLDEMCEEYFQNEKDNAAALKLGTQSAKRYTGGENDQNTETKFGKHHHMIEDPSRPSHLYFSSTDVRIRDLVRSRLPNFFPLDDSSNRGVRPPGVESIDYMSQFGKNEGDSMSQTRARKGRGKATMVRNEKKKMAAIRTSGSRIGKVGGVCSEKSKRLSSGAPYMEKPSTVDSFNWLTPKSETKPKNVGKRRVHAQRSTGFWYTAEGSQKVYVTKTGEELVGSSAYRQYNKENKSKRKKIVPKKK